MRSSKFVIKFFFIFLFIITISQKFTIQQADAAVLPATIIPNPVASAMVTTTTSWQYQSTSTTSDNTTIAKYGNKTGYTQATPGATNATNGAAKPSTPNGKGFIYDTPLDSTIPTGTWTFNFKYTNTVSGGTSVITICAWKVTVSGGAISASTNFINCVDDSTNFASATHTGASIAVSVASVPAESFTANQYLYVEYWVHSTVVSGSTTAQFKVFTGVNATDIVTPGASSNLAPNAPSQDLPANSATSVSTTPVFKTTGTDSESDNLQYKVTIYSNSLCTTVVQTNDETSSQTGWSGQNVSGTSYTSGTQGVYTTQSALSPTTQYWWKASAIDPTGSNTFVDSASCNTFTTAGVLSMSTPSSATLNAVTVNSVPVNGTGNVGTITVTDNRGTNVGWTLTATSTDFVSGGHTIAVTNLTINPGSVTLISGSLTGVSAGSSHTFTSTSDVATLMSASSTHGNGGYSVNPALTLSVPVGSYAGTYTETITETVQ